MVGLNRNITEIIVHCSDSDIKSHDNIETITQWHTDPKPKGNGWSDIGYHYVITRDGHLHRGRPLERSGAHVAGRNGASIGICLTGKENFTQKQFIALAALCRSFSDTLKIPIERINGHYKFSKTKTCPNFVVSDKLDEYA